MTSLDRTSWEEDDEMSDETTTDSDKNNSNRIHADMICGQLMTRQSVVSEHDVLTTRNDDEYSTRLEQQA